MALAPTERADDVAERAFVLFSWLALSLAAFVYVLRFAPNLPFGDDWLMVPVLAGAEPLTLRWLWTPLNEHRLPLAKLVFYTLAELTGSDFRAPMLLSALLLSAAALGGIEAARRARGQQAYSDAFLPLVLLSWGHRQNLLWAVQLFFVMFAVLGCTIAFLILEGRYARSVRAAWVLGGLIAVLPLNGAMGLVAALPLAVWAVSAGRVLRREDGDAARGAALLTGAGVAFTLVALYLIGYEPLASHPAPPPWSAFVGTLRALGMGLGPPPRLALWRAPALVLGLLGAASVARLIHVFVTRPVQRTRAGGLLAALAAAAVVLAALGAGRAHLGWRGALATRYSVLAMLFPVAAYCAWAAYDGLRLGRLVPMCFFTVGCMALALNTMTGYGHGQQRRAMAEEIYADIRSGLPPEELARRYADTDLGPNERVLAYGFRALRQQRRGPYRPGFEAAPVVPPSPAPSAGGG